MRSRHYKAEKTGREEKRLYKKKRETMAREGERVEREMIKGKENIEN